MILWTWKKNYFISNGAREMKCARNRRKNFSNTHFWPRTNCTNTLILSRFIVLFSYSPFFFFFSVKIFISNNKQPRFRVKTFSILLEIFDDADNYYRYLLKVTNFYSLYYDNFQKNSISPISFLTNLLLWV